MKSFTIVFGAFFLCNKKLKELLCNFATTSKIKELPGGVPECSLGEEVCQRETRTKRRTLGNWIVKHRTLEEGTGNTLFPRLAK